MLPEKIRSLPDFNDFLRPPKAVNLLSSLPSDGPVIIFNIDNTLRAQINKAGNFILLLSNKYINNIKLWIHQISEDYLF
jgi:hypothetical protein